MYVSIAYVLPIMMASHPLRNPITKYKPVISQKESTNHCQT